MTCRIKPEKKKRKTILIKQLHRDAKRMNRLCGGNKMKPTFVTQFDESTSGEWTTDLQSFGYNTWRDQFVWWYFLVQFFISWLVEQDLIVQLVTDFSFWPLLLLGFAAATSFLLLLGLLWLLSRRFCILFGCLKWKQSKKL